MDLSYAVDTAIGAADGAEVIAQLARDAIAEANGREKSEDYLPLIVWTAERLSAELCGLFSHLRRMQESSCVEAG